MIDNHHASIHGQQGFALKRLRQNPHGVLGWGHVIDQHIPIIVQGFGNPKLHQRA